MYEDGHTEYLAAYNTFWYGRVHKDTTQKITAEQFLMYIRNGVIDTIPNRVEHLDGMIHYFFRAY